MCESHVTSYLLVLNWKQAKKVPLHMRLVLEMFVLKSRGRKSQQAERDALKYQGGTYIHSVLLLLFVSVGEVDSCSIL